jgi:hypothetical protein
MAAVRWMETPDEQKKGTIRCTSVAKTGTNLAALCKTSKDMDSPVVNTVSPSYNMAVYRMVYIYIKGKPIPLQARTCLRAP